MSDCHRGVILQDFVNGVHEFAFRDSIDLVVALSNIRTGESKYEDSCKRQQLFFTDAKVSASFLNFHLEAPAVLDDFP